MCVVCCGRIDKQARLDWYFVLEWLNDGVVRVVEWEKILTSEGRPTQLIERFNSMHA